MSRPSAAVAPNRSDGWPYADVVVALLLFGLHLLLYSRTLPPGLAYAVDPFNPPGDTHEFTMAIAELRLARRTGYPLYTWLGYLFTRAFPIGEIAYRTNLLSAVFGAGAVSAIYAVARRLVLGRAAAAVAAVAFGVATTFWSQAVITEVYTLNVLALAVVLWCLLRWSELRTTASFATFALAYGISLGCHTSNLALGAVFAIFVLVVDRDIVRRPKTLAIAFLAFLAGVAQYVWVPLMADTAQFPNPRPDSLIGFYKYTLGAFSNLRFAYPLHALPRRFAFYLSMLEVNFSWLGIALGLAGMWAFGRRRAAAFLLFSGIFVVNVAIAVQVYATDTEVFFLPSYVAWTIFVGFGVQWLWNRLALGGGRLGAGARRVVTRALRLAFAVGLGAWASQTLQASFAANDHRDDTVFEDFYATVFSLLPNGSHLAVGPGVFGQGVVYYQKVLGVRPDVTLHTDVGRMQMPPQPVFAVLPLVDGRARQPFGGSPFPPNAWMIPVLLTGNQRTLTLYRVDRDPPRLKTPGVSPGQRQDSTTLFGSTVSVVDGMPRPRLHLSLQWAVADAQRHTVLTSIDGAVVDTRALGLGNLGRYAREVEPLGGAVLSEVYDLLLPRSLGSGTHDIEFGTIEVTGHRSVRKSSFSAGSFTIE